MAHPAHLAAALQHQQTLADQRKSTWDSMFNNPANVAGPGVQMDRPPPSIPDPPFSVEGRPAIVPLQRNAAGELEWTIPAIVAEALNAITAPKRAMDGSNFDAKKEALNMASVLAGGGGGLGASRVARAPVGSLGMNVYHGSPHKMAPTQSNPLGEFDSKLIGTGEGNQSYAYGHYLAENPEVGVKYQKKTSLKHAVRQFREELYDDDEADDVMAVVNAGKLPENQTALLRALEKDDWLGFDYPFEAVVAAFKDLKYFDASPELVAAVEKYGYLYKVDFPDEHIAKMLDWDKPLIHQGWEKTFAKLPEFARPLDATEASNVTGQRLYQRLANKLGDEGASKALREAGILGIRYLDQHSRAGGKGTSNFVVFPGGEKMLNILERQ